jgi:hypothetical protein
MRNFLIGAVVSGSLVLALPLLAGPKGPKPPKAEKVAVELAVASMQSGAYQTMLPQDLVDYCVEAAKALEAADYTTP